MMRKVATLSLAISLLSGCQYLNSVNQRKLKVVGESKVVAEDRDLDDMFGSILRADGDTLVVGAYRDDDPFPAYEHVSDDGHDAGTAYVFVRDVNGLIQQAKLLPADRVTAGQFGHSVAIAANTIIAGAPRARTGEGVITGAVYVFERQGTVWSQHAKLAPSDGIDFDEFGWSAAISGNTAVVGAYMANGADGTVDTGAAYIFVRDGANWIEQAKLTASDAATGDAFGVSVAISGDTVVIGARSDDHAAGDDAGSLYVFSRTGTTWTQQAKLTAGDGAASDGFGTSVAVDGSKIFAGADGVDGFDASNVGAVYVFSYNGTDWAEETKLTASDAEGDDHFGFDVSARQGILAVGAYTVNANATAAGRDFGAAYIFMQSGATWQEQPRLMAADGAREDYFGCSVAVARTAIYAGACRDDAMGSAWVFEIDAPNQVPVAAAGPDQTVSCTSPGQPVSVTLNGSGSSDPDGDALTHTWLENGVVLATGVNPTIALHVGTHNLALVVNDGRVDSLPDEVQIVVNDCQSDCSPPEGSVWERCTPECPCQDGVGDCDVDADCVEGGRCVHDVGPSYGYDDSEMDVCVVGCPDLGVGGFNFCTPECPCAHGQADCDDDTDCEPGLRCLHDVGPSYGYSDSEIDVCVAGCPEFGAGGWHFCTTECPCSEGEGDCDSNSECANGLRCVRNVGPSYGYDDPDIDVCLTAAAATTSASPSMSRFSVREE